MDFSPADFAVPNQGLGASCGDRSSGDHAIFIGSRLAARPRAVRFMSACRFDRGLFARARSDVTNWPWQWMRDGLDEWRVRDENALIKKRKTGGQTFFHRKTLAATGLQMAKKRDFFFARLVYTRECGNLMPDRSSVSRLSSSSNAIRGESGRRLLSAMSDFARRVMWELELFRFRNFGWRSIRAKLVFS